MILERRRKRPPHSNCTETCKRDFSQDDPSARPSAKSSSVRCVPGCPAPSAARSVAGVPSAARSLPGGGAPRAARRAFARAMPAFPSFLHPQKPNMAEIPRYVIFYSVHSTRSAITQIADLTFYNRLSARDDFNTNEKSHTSESLPETRCSLAASALVRRTSALGRRPRAGRPILAAPTARARGRSMPSSARRRP